MSNFTDIKEGSRISIEISNILEGFMMLITVPHPKVRCINFHIQFDVLRKFRCMTIVKPYIVSHNST